MKDDFNNTGLVSPAAADGRARWRNSMGLLYRPVRRRFPSLRERTATSVNTLKFSRRGRSKEHSIDVVNHWRLGTNKAICFPLDDLFVFFSIASVAD
jgi:hypothetical protein